MKPLLIILFVILFASCCKEEHKDYLCTQDEVIYRNEFKQDSIIKSGSYALYDATNKEAEAYAHKYTFKAWKTMICTRDSVQVSESQVWVEAKMHCVPAICP